MSVIIAFVGQMRFLSNFFPATVQVDGLDFPTVEHAYQASKTNSPNMRARIAELETPGQAKAVGRTLALRADWEEVKLDVMYGLLQQKFAHARLRERLLATGNSFLVEGNTWGDTFWGHCDGKGTNHLGYLLMQLRDEIRQND